MSALTTLLSLGSESLGHERAENISEPWMFEEERTENIANPGLWEIVHWKHCKTWTAWGWVHWKHSRNNGFWGIERSIKKVDKLGRLKRACWKHCKSWYWMGVDACIAFVACSHESIRSMARLSLGQNISDESSGWITRSSRNHWMKFA